MSMEINLKQFGNVPVNVDVITSLLKGYNAPLQKLMNMERQGDLIRIKRGIYVVAPKISGKKLSSGLIANHLYGRSYVSMQTALREYGLIPERVFSIKSMTTERSRRIETTLGEFVYVQCPPKYYSIGVTIYTEEGVSYMIASPEKALCDLVISTPNLNLRFLTSTEQYLEEDIRFDMDALKKMNSSIFRECAQIGRKKTSLLNIAKLIDKD